MRWVVLGVATLVAAAAALGPASSPLPTSSAPVTVSVDLRPVAYVPPTGSVQAKVLDLVNEQRSRVGCRPVYVHKALVTSSRRHNSRMVATGSLSHTLAGEAPLKSRVNQAGYTRPIVVAENIAYGYNSATGVIRGWMRSSVHRGILQDCRLRHMGVSKMTGDGLTWWTLDFGRR